MLRMFSKIVYRLVPGFSNLLEEINSLRSANTNLSEQLNIAKAARLDAEKQRERAEAARWEEVRQRERAEAARWEAVKQGERAEAARWEAAKQGERAEAARLDAIRLLEKIIRERQRRDPSGDSMPLSLNERIELILHTRWHTTEEVPAVDHTRITNELLAILDDPGFTNEPLDCQKAFLSYAHGLISQSWHESGRKLRPVVERVLERYLQQPVSNLDLALIAYDFLYFLYWCWADSIDEQKGFARVIRSFSQAFRSGRPRLNNNKMALRPQLPIKIVYIAQFMSPEPGNAIVPISLRFLMALARQPSRYAPILYAWMSRDEKTLDELRAMGIVVREITDETPGKQLSSIENYLHQDQPELLVTDMNTALPTVIFERRMAPIQIFYQFGLPYWPIENLDGVFRIWETDPGRVGFAPEKCFKMVSPWNFAVLAPSVDPARVATERAKFPKGRLIGIYGRLAKITPLFLSSVAQAIREIRDVTVLLGGSGDDGTIGRALRDLGMEGRFIVLNRYVDGHLWGHFLDIFLDTFPQQGFTSCREMIAKGKPVLSHFSDETPNFAQERVPQLVADTPKEYTLLLERLLRDSTFYDNACAASRDLARSMPTDDDYAATLSNAIDSLRLRHWGPTIALVHEPADAANGG